MPKTQLKVSPIANQSNDDFLDDKGVYQLQNGHWAFRFSVRVNGKLVSKRCSTDTKGKPLLTKQSATIAKAQAIMEAQGVRVPVVSTMGTVYNPSTTLDEVYELYRKSGRTDRSYSTIRRQDGLWDNHLKAVFGGKRFNTITLADIQDYLSTKYYVEGYSYRYIESFLKMFYLIFGQAYNRNIIPPELYNQFCLHKNTKIHMPKIKSDEDLSIVAFTKEECEILDAYFEGTNAETAYLLGRHLGLRINECYGLKWENVDFEKKTITIENQMAYQEGLILLAPLKTRNARRTLFMNQKLFSHLQEQKRIADEADKTLVLQRKQNQTIITDANGEPLSSLLLVNSLPDGKIQTVNSMKYHARVIQEKYGIHFKYHYLRHTYGTRLAEMNTPTHMLCNQMGHASVQVTQQYYIAIAQGGIEALKKNIDLL